MPTGKPPRPGHPADPALRAMRAKPPADSPSPLARRSTPSAATRMAQRITLRAAPRGFTYLWLLFVLALSAGVLGVAAERISTGMQREKERELIFRGHEIAAAIASYRAATAGGEPQWPRSFDELLDDRRHPVNGQHPRHHLRRLYTDPFTGQADWVRITGEDGALHGVRSRSGVAALITQGVPARAPKATVRVSDRVFMARTAPAASGASSAASARSGTPEPATSEPET